MRKLCSIFVAFAAMALTGCIAHVHGLPISHVHRLGCGHQKIHGHWVVVREKHSHKHKKTPHKRHVHGLACGHKKVRGRWILVDPQIVSPHPPATPPGPQVVPTTQPDAHEHHKKEKHKPKKHKKDKHHKKHKHEDQDDESSGRKGKSRRVY